MRLLLLLVLFCFIFVSCTTQVTSYNSIKIDDNLYAKRYKISDENGSVYNIFLVVDSNGNRTDIVNSNYSSGKTTKRTLTVPLNSKIEYGMKSKEEIVNKMNEIIIGLTDSETTIDRKKELTIEYSVLSWVLKGSIEK